MDHDLFHREGDDYLVPPPDSALWERLPTPAARYICRREAKRFYALDDAEKGSKSAAELKFDHERRQEAAAKGEQVADPRAVHRRLAITLLVESNEIRIGRHTLRVNPADIAHLKERY